VLKGSVADMATKAGTCPVTGGDHQFKARRSSKRRAAKIGAGLIFAPLALAGGKNQGQCTACGKKVTW